MKTCHLQLDANANVCVSPSTPHWIQQDSWEDEEEAEEKKDEEKVKSATVSKVKPKSKLQEKIAEKEVRKYITQGRLAMVPDSHQYPIFILAT